MPVLLIGHVPVAEIDGAHQIVDEVVRVHPLDEGFVDGVLRQVLALGVVGDPGPVGLGALDQPGVVADDLHLLLVDAEVALEIIVVLVLVEIVEAVVLPVDVHRHGPGDRHVDIQTEAEPGGEGVPDASGGIVLAGVADAQGGVLPPAVLAKEGIGHAALAVLPPQVDGQRQLLVAQGARALGLEVRRELGGKLAALVVAEVPLALLLAGGHLGPGGGQRLQVLGPQGDADHRQLVGLREEEGIGDDLAVQEPVLLGEGPDHRILFDLDGPVVHRGGGRGLAAVGGVVDDGALAGGQHQVEGARLIEAGLGELGGLGVAQGVLVAVAGALGGLVEEGPGYGAVALDAARAPLWFQHTRGELVPELARFVLQIQGLPRQGQAEGAHAVPAAYLVGGGLEHRVSPGGQGAGEVHDLLPLPVLPQPPARQVHGLRGGVVQLYPVVAARSPIGADLADEDAGIVVAAPVGGSIGGGTVGFARRGAKIVFSVRAHGHVGSHLLRQGEHGIGQGFGVVKDQLFPPVHGEIGLQEPVGPGRAVPAQQHQQIPVRRHRHVREGPFVRVVRAVGKIPVVQGDGAVRVVVELHEITIFPVGGHGRVLARDQHLRHAHPQGFHLHRVQGGEDPAVGSAGGGLRAVAPHAVRKAPAHVSLQGRHVDPAYLLTAAGKDVQRLPPAGDAHGHGGMALVVAAADGHILAWLQGDLGQAMLIGLLRVVGDVQVPQAHGSGAGVVELEPVLGRAAVIRTFPIPGGSDLGDLQLDPLAGLALPQGVDLLRQGGRRRGHPLMGYLRRGRHAAPRQQQQQEQDRYAVFQRPLQRSFSLLYPRAIRSRASNISFVSV